MGLRGGVQARIDTASTTVHRSLDAVARRKSQLLPPAASRVRTLFADLETHVPLDAQRLLGFACGLHGYMRTARAHVPVKTAMEKEQRRERERNTRMIEPVRVANRQYKFPSDPLLYMYSFSPN